MKMMRRMGVIERFSRVILTQATLLEDTDALITLVSLKIWVVL